MDSGLDQDKSVFGVFVLRKGILVLSFGGRYTLKFVETLKVEMIFLRFNLIFS